MEITYIGRSELLWAAKSKISTLTVTLPTPVLLPVTIMTFPVRSGMSSMEKCGEGGQDWLMAEEIICPIARENRGIESRNQ